MSARPSARPLGISIHMIGLHHAKRKKPKEARDAFSLVWCQSWKHGVKHHRSAHSCRFHSSSEEEMVLDLQYESGNGE
ncbi:hypothetical protein NHX12_009809 [Muraenolepis orangiensis]|uniref:Uncharacterized protein n=1 Tax=Muraenolepis orangiensis TaxID=630683 RepID=A0A9Q0I9U7_9TELE|nr:hypothetical protein NHX12_009809 [Muraenolepis orangiensis]